MGTVRINQFTDGPTGHVNITFSPGTVNAVTFGANINSSTGWAGVQDETNSTIARIANSSGNYSYHDIYLDEGNFNAALAMASGKAVLTANGFNNYAGFCGNCVDFAGSILPYANQAALNIGNYLTNGTLTDLYANSAMYLCNTSYGDFMDSLGYTPSYVQNAVSALGLETGYFGFGNLSDQMIALFTYVADRLGDANLALEYYSLVARVAEYGQYGSPIAIDLNGDGVQTIGLWESSVHFDVTGDGAAEKTAWLSSDDAFVVVDANGNGRVDGVNEMFGGMARGVGFAEFGAFDSNHDAVINVLDTGFANLRLWRDANSNGATDSGELMTLAAAGVSEFSLAVTSQEGVYDHANLIGEVATAVLAGQAVQTADVYLAYSL